jgi:hypothetical protein
MNARTHARTHGRARGLMYARAGRQAIYGDNSHAISVSKDRSMLCWDLQSEKRISSHRQKIGGLNAVTLTRDQKWVITAGQEQSIRCAPKGEVGAL